ncbi:hypothetical protein NECAME_11563 [Necator americanus]|uniref:ERAP1-like C-terminal domain-containing protein n=1 Tax=Necator americanus TaxID=51031 RepID=W2T3Y1_NECAM|nr:hypothetical protein NECAME_11563 [Necator americanus]ETN76613.1 hypothetical protein NECAME_11563 [Necator americanus]
MSKLGARIGWDCHDGEDSQRSILRAIVHGRLMRAGHDETIEKALSLFSDHIFTSAARNGGETAFDELLQIYEGVGFPEVERNCMTALSQTQNPNLLRRLFRYAIKDGKARAQDHMLLFYGANISRIGQEFLWNYFKENMSLLIEKFGGVNSSLFQRCLKLSIERQCSEEFATEVESFLSKSLKPQELQTLSRPIKQATESVRLNRNLMQWIVNDIDTFLTSQGM